MGQIIRDEEIFIFVSISKYRFQKPNKCKTRDEHLEKAQKELVDFIYAIAFFIRNQSACLAISSVYPLTHQVGEKAR